MKQFIDARAAGRGAAGPRRPAGCECRPPTAPQPVVVVAHEESNKLLVSAPASKFAQLRRMIEELDERQRQVLVECAVVELATSDLKRWGIELGFLDIKARRRLHAAVRLHELRPVGRSSDTDDDGLPDTRLPDFDEPAATASRAASSAAATSRSPSCSTPSRKTTRANVLSVPSVIVNNNENALIESSKEDRPTQEIASRVTATTSSPVSSGFEGRRYRADDLALDLVSNNYLRLNIDLAGLADSSRRSTPRP